MRFIIIIFITCALVACGGSSDQMTSNNNSLFLQKSNFNSTNACESIDNINLEMILDWRAEDMMKKEDHFDGQFSVCTINHPEENLLVRLSWKSIASQNNNVLASNYDKWLTEGENEILYTKIDETTDYEIIFGTGPLPGQQKQYIARKRFGNNSEAQIELITAGSNNVDAKDKLVKLLSTIK